METWNERCLKYIRSERQEIEKRYSIKIGQTEIYCDRCGARWGFGGHTCNGLNRKSLQKKDKVLF